MPDPQRALPEDPPPAAPKLSDLFRPSRGQALVGVLLALVGLAITWQVRLLSSQEDYSTLRRGELVSILDDLTAESRRLETQVAELEQTRAELESGADSQQAAAEEAGRRRDQLAILAGTVSATGQGIRVVIQDPELKVGGSVLLNAISELRDAGAEVIEINDAIRVVATSYVSGDGPELCVDGAVLQRPIVIEAIGESHALSEALRFRGGLASEIADERIGGSVAIEEKDSVEIASVRALPEPSFARPA